MAKKSKYVVTSYKDIDYGWDKLKKELISKKNRYVTVGVHADRAQRSDGANNLLLAMAHEFGLGVPERSFIRDTMDKNELIYITYLKQMMGMVVAGRITKDRAIQLVGLKIQADMKNYIAAGIDPPNAPVTIARKGSSTPLIDTGQLINAIDFEVGP